MLNTRVPLKVIEEISGHSNFAITATFYTNVLSTMQLESDFSYLHPYSSMDDARVRAVMHTEV